MICDANGIRSLCFVRRIDSTSQYRKTFPIISPWIGNIVLACNMLYLALIRPNSSKRKWFCFLRFKINSSLVPKFSQDLLKILGTGFRIGVKLLFPSDSLINYTHLHSNQDQLGFRQNRSEQPDTIQSGVDGFCTTRDDVLLSFPTMLAAAHSLDTV